MAHKLDLTRNLFVGPATARANSVLDAIRRGVVALDEGEGVPYAKLEEYLLRNYSPAKAKNYDSTFIKSYVRDAVNKSHHLSYEAGSVYGVTAAPAPKPKKARRVTKAHLEELDVLVFLRDRGEVHTIGDIDSPKITPEDVVAETKRKQKTVDKIVESLVKQGFARVDSVPGNDEGDVVRYVYLTPAGLAAANEREPEGSASQEGAEEGSEVPENQVA